MQRPSSFILIILGITLFYTFTTHQYDTLKEKRAEAAEYQNVIDNVENIVETRDRLLEDYRAIPRDQIDRLFKVLPDNADSVRLALDLDTIASSYGISISNVRVADAGDPNARLLVLPNSKKSYDKARVSFSFVSNYDNFRQLLLALERNLRIMDVKSVGFEATDDGLYKHEMIVETYWLK